MNTVLAVLSILVGLLATLVMMTLVMAGGANAKPNDVRILKVTLVSVLVIGIASAVAATVLVVRGKNGPAALVGLVPVVVNIALVIIAVVTEF